MDADTIVVLKPKNFYEWYEQIKGLAISHNVWKYLDPELDVEVPRPIQPPNYASYDISVQQTAVADGEDGVALQTTTRKANAISELSPIDREIYESEVECYEITNNRIQEGIMAVNTAIARLAKKHVPSPFHPNMTKKTLASLSKQFKLSDAEMREVICQRHRRLQTAPSRLYKVEAWITKWTNLRYDKIALNIDMISESQMSHDFLKAGAKWAHDFCMLWPTAMRSAKKEMKFLDTTSEYRDEII